jgi:hypothetical protein
MVNLQEVSNTIRYINCRPGLGRFEEESDQNHEQRQNLGPKEWQPLASMIFVHLSSPGVLKLWQQNQQR